MKASLSLSQVFLAFVFFHGLNVYAQNQAPDITLEFYIDEHVPAGTLVGAISADDPDGDPLSFSIISGNTDDTFTINTTSGEITVSNEAGLDFEVNPVFNLVLEADDGQGGMTNAAIIINLNDIDENPLGIEDEIKVLIYPNPIVSSFYIETKEHFDDDAYPVIYSINGREIPLKLQKLSSSKFQVFLPSITSGIYLLRIEDRKQSKTNRMIFIR